MVRVEPFVELELNLLAQWHYGQHEWFQEAECWGVLLSDRWTHGQTNERMDRHLWFLSRFRNWKDVWKIHLIISNLILPCLNKMISIWNNVVCVMYQVCVCDMPGAVTDLAPSHPPPHQSSSLHQSSSGREGAGLVRAPPATAPQSAQSSPVYVSEAALPTLSTHHHTSDNNCVMWWQHCSDQDVVISHQMTTSQLWWQQVQSVSTTVGCTVSSDQAYVTIRNCVKPW